MKRNGNRRINQYVFLCRIVLFLAISGLTVAMQAVHEAEAKGEKENMVPNTNTQSPGLPLIDKVVPSLIETATFGLGWFWGVESQFGIIEGVIRTRVGYAGGQMGAPTYNKMGDHSETIQVDYDPSLITYRQLLDIFWQSHQPEKSTWSRQYMHAVFYHDEGQRQQVVTSRVSLEQKNGYRVKTEVLPLRSFTMAEDYHQKYLLKVHDELRNDLVRIYPSHQSLVDSTAAARLNGYAGGHGNKTQLSREIDSLGLGTRGKKKLLKLVQK